MSRSCFLALIGVIATTAHAEFEMPKHVYRMTELDKATAEAKQKNEPITFIYTHEKTSCGLCRAASLNAADRLKSKSVVVYADSDTEWAKIPAVVQEALSSPEAGKYIPKTVIANADFTKVLAVIPYALGDEQNDLLRDAIRGTGKVYKPTPLGATRRPPPAALAPSAPIAHDETREARVWISKSGATITAALVEMSAGYVILKSPEGKQFKVLPAQLSNNDQQYLTQLQASLAPALP